MKPLIPWFDVPILQIPFGDQVLPIHGFGVLVAIGFVVGNRVAMDRARKLGLDPEVLNRLVGWLVAGTMIGGHVGYGLLYEPAEYLSHPVEFLKVWHGLSSFGGFATCVPLAVWYFRRERVPVWPYLDCLAHGLTIGWFFGRMGCFVAHDHPGTPTRFWLGVYGICKPDGDPSVACHDLGLYEGLWSLGTFAVFQLLERWRRWSPGFFVLALGLSYAPIRFVLDFFRPEVTDARYWGFTPAQYGSMALMAVCLAVILRQRFPSEAPQAEPG